MSNLNPDHWKEQALMRPALLNNRGTIKDMPEQRSWSRQPWKGIAGPMTPMARNINWVGPGLKRGMQRMMLFVTTIFGCVVGWFSISYLQTHKQRDMIIAFTALVLGCVFGALYVLTG